MLELIWQEVLKTQRRAVHIAAALARSIATKEQLPMVERGVKTLLDAIAATEARASQQAFNFKPRKGSHR
jgi:hypothetical protein